MLVGACLSQLAVLDGELDLGSGEAMEMRIWLLDLYLSYEFMQHVHPRQQNIP